MLDKLISLATYPGKAGPAAGSVEVELEAIAPQVQPRLRLWNQAGRDPREPPRVPGANRWRLGTPESLAGWTLTWSVRMAPDPARRSRFELRVQLFQDGDLLPDGTFFYAGPLEALEERSGRFHFTAGPNKTSG